MTLAYVAIQNYSVPLVSSKPDSADVRSQLIQLGRQRERQDMQLRLAWTLFRERVSSEARLRSERKHIESVLLIMWTKTRTDARDECLARADELFKAMRSSIPDGGVF